MSLSIDLIERIRSRVGKTVRGKYRLDRLIGIGGTAAVFEATHRNGSRVALKELHPEYARLEEVRTRFLREGYVANRVGHPAVTRVLDDDDDDETMTVFLVMELLEGETVEALWERQARHLPLPMVLGYADQLLDVLAAAHEQGIVHRDVKPENLFHTRGGMLKVLDFGIARLLDGTGATRSGQLLGTPEFMAPEQANGAVRQIDARTDLWSVGAVIYTLVSGSAVHAGRSAHEQIVYAATQQARPVELVAPGIGRDVAAVVNRALAFQQEARWQSAREMQAALRATRGYVEPSRGAPDSLPPQTARTSEPNVPLGQAPSSATLVYGSPTTTKR